MADKRKLQGEIDRCIKKVAEGVASFEDVWQKVQSAPTLNQKEKFEADLKKEIKKLQRLRDQIKTWLASSDIKDKRQLTENRKIIESQMERFKVVERETKTKAYSKEGLGAATKVDPREKEKEETKDWVTTCIDALQLQKDQFESEIEGIDTKKKGNKDRVEELKNLLTQHQEHVDSLELVLRGVDNDQVDLEQLRRIRESIEYYVESRELESGDLSIYDDLNLDALRLSCNALGVGFAANDDDCLSNSSDPPMAIAGSSPSLSTINHSKDKPLAQEDDKKKHKSHEEERKNSGSKASSTGLQLNCAPIPITPTKKDAITISNSLETPDTPLRTPPPVAYAQAVSGNQNNRTTSTSSQQPTTITATKPPPAPAWNIVGETKPTADPAASSAQHQPASAQVAASSGAPVTNGSNNVAMNALASQPTPGATTSVEGSLPSTAASLTSPPADSSSTSVATSLSTLSSFSTALHPSLSSSALPSESKIPNGPTSAAGSALIKNQTDLSTAGNGGLTKLPVNNASPHDPASLAPASLSTLASSVFDNLPPSSLPSSDLSSLPQLLMQQQQGQGQLPSFLLHQHQQGQGLAQQQAGQGLVSSQQQQQTPLQTTTIHLSPLLGVAPLGTQPLTKEQLYQVALLDTANMHLPYPSDSERLRYYLPRNPCPAPPYYPQAAPAQSDAVEFYQKLSVETLFFIFYYMEGTKAQYLAAKALKKQSWRFHTKYMMWFQRHEEPKMITEDYEQGTYVYFDYEKWCQRKKDGFTFEYRFLEDRDLN